MAKLILASSSPRRSELLTMLGADFTAVNPGGETEPEGLPPHETVVETARHKARTIAPLFPGDIIIAADTLVYLDGAALGKPRDADEAASYLRRLSGRAHDVYTGLCVIQNGREAARCERTRVRFRELSDGEIARYVATGEPMDKAGAYGAQGRGALFIEGVEGDFYNVVGLPLCALGILLREFGAEL